MASKKREFVNISSQNELKTIKELKNVQKDINKSFSEQSEEWVKKFLQPIIDMMGSITSTFPIFHDIKVHLNTSSRINQEKYKEGKHAIYTGSHWVAIKNGIIFDPFDHCQIYGTNQFCQTYTLMWLTDNLTMYDEPQEEGQEIAELDKYYFYTKQAIDFIKNNVLPKYNKKHRNLIMYKKCIKVLYNNPTMCLNLVDLPPKYLINI